MPQTSMRSWSRKVLALLGLLVVVPAWPIAKVVEGLAKRFPDARQAAACARFLINTCCRVGGPAIGPGTGRCNRCGVPLGLRVSSAFCNTARFE